MSLVSSGVIHALKVSKRQSVQAGAERAPKAGRKRGVRAAHVSYCVPNCLRISASSVIDIGKPGGMSGFAICTRVLSQNAGADTITTRKAPGQVRGKALKRQTREANSDWEPAVRGRLENGQAER